MTMRMISTGLALWAASGAAEEPKPQVAPFPLEIVRVSRDASKKDREDLQKLLPMLVRAAKVEVPDAARLSTAVTELKRQDCDRDDNCLAQLAKLAGSLYGLFVQVDYDLDGRVVATGRVVRDDGKVMGEPKTVRLPKEQAPFRDVARAAISELLGMLDVARLSAFRPKEPAAAAAPLTASDAVPPPTTRAATKSRSLFVIPAVIVTGAGLASAVGGAVLFSASTIRTDLNGNVFRDDASRVSAVQTNQAAGVALVTVGAILAAGGGAWLMFGPTETTTTLVPISDGAALLVTGVLP